MFLDNFSRYEFKFPMTYADMDLLIGEINPYVAPDEHVNEQGIYSISSIYLDNAARQCYYETVNNDFFRQKVRLRVYGLHNDGDSPAFLEIKGKIDGLVVKRRVRMTVDSAMRFIGECVDKGNGFDLSRYRSTNTQILEELRRVIVAKSLRPVNVVSYERLPFVCLSDPDLRITFDYNVRTRGEDLDLTHGTYGERSCPEGVAILEVKTSKAIPYWLVEILGGFGYRNQTFSKYCSHFAPQPVMLSGPESGNTHGRKALDAAAAGGEKELPGENVLHGLTGDIKATDTDRKGNPDAKGEYKYVANIFDVAY
ncbi:MAG: polyphosphate polymerase domain-containing protein [Clostridia bacterium]|nr:polyphosphate polymerase domain-containing protein [Clostridia bacterium]